jgi:hypothetical protein
MATKKNTETVVVADFQEESVPQGGYDLAAKHPVWSPLDGVAVKGMLLGVVDLPSAQANQDRWVCYVLRLTGKTLVRDAGDKSLRVANAGELVLLTVQSSLKRVEAAALDRTRCFELYLKPGGKEKTKSGGTVQTYDNMILMNPVARSRDNVLPSTIIPRGLGTGDANGIADEATPFG